MSTPSTWQTIRTLLTPRRIVMLGIAGVLFLAVLWWIRQFIDLTPQGLRTLMAPFGWWGGLLLSGIIALILVDGVNIVSLRTALLRQMGSMGNLNLVDVIFEQDIKPLGNIHLLKSHLLHVFLKQGGD